MTDKMQDELRAFREFKRHYNFIQKEIVEVSGELFCDGEPLENEDGSVVAESESWVNVGYKLKNSASKALSNLFPYEFEFRGQHLYSIEAFFQGCKFPDSIVQRCVFTYSGVDAYHVQIASDYNWKESGYVYWQGEKIKRDSQEYDDLIDELYIAAVQNPLYRNILGKTDKYILHSIGKENKSETVFTRYELEKELNCLSAFLKLRK